MDDEDRTPDVSGALIWLMDQWKIPESFRV
jgi:hypothetical protein